MIITNVGHEIKLNPKAHKDCSLKHLESTEKTKLWLKELEWWWDKSQTNQSLNLNVF